MRFKTYHEVLDYLYGNLPMFQRQGAAAFRKDLSKTIQFDRHLDHPHKHFRSIHIAGTNGKGSTAHMMAAICQESGYKTGLYTSPHLRDFTERIKINGKPMVPDAVVDFVNNNFDAIQEIKPSFFEITLAMAFQYFKDEEVDIAVLETGMGGRLDSTNIVTPILSIITNVSYDHQQFLGETLPEIASEKAGIIKKQIPVVVSERQKEIEHVFISKSKEMNAPIYFAKNLVELNKIDDEHYSIENDKNFAEDIHLSLLGNYQIFNLGGVLAACKLLNKYDSLIIPKEAIYKGISNVKKLTGLKGRYQIVRKEPKVICDVAHNEAGLRLVTEQLKNENYKELYFVISVVNDKDLSKLWDILPKDAWYLFTQADIPRALPAEILMKNALANGLKGELVMNIPDAYDKALAMADKNDLIFVGGSTFTVAEIKDLYDEE